MPTAASKKTTKQKKIEFFTNVALVDTSTLSAPDWNYKTEGDEESLARFEQSLLAGKMTPLHAAACAESPGRIEVFDGAHRLGICRKHRLKKVPIWNHGTLTLAQRQRLSLQYNGAWFGTEAVKLAEALEIVLEEQPNAADMLPFDSIELDQAIAALNLDADLNFSGEDDDEEELVVSKKRTAKNDSKHNTKATKKATRIECPQCKHKFNV